MRVGLSHCFKQPKNPVGSTKLRLSGQLFLWSLALLQQLQDRWPVQFRTLPTIPTMHWTVTLSLITSLNPVSYEQIDPSIGITTELGLIAPIVEAVTRCFGSICNSCRSNHCKTYCHIFVYRFRTFCRAEYLRWHFRHFPFLYGPIERASLIEYSKRILTDSENSSRTFSNTPGHSEPSNFTSRLIGGPM